MSVSSALAQFFFPQRHCLLCGALTGQPGLCAVCQEQRRQFGRCKVCAAFLPADGVCADCARTRPKFTQARAAGPYERQMRERLLSFKYHEQTWLRRPLAVLLLQTYAEHYAHIRFDAVTAAPLSTARFQKRGYNQSELLSALLAAELKLPHRPMLLKRVADTPPLATYDGAQRRALLKKAFAVTEPVAGQTLLVVDDIYTTGATINALASILLAAGAREVYGLTVAAFRPRS